MYVHHLKGLVVLSVAETDVTPSSDLKLTAESSYCRSFLTGDISVVLLHDMLQNGTLKPVSAKLLSNFIYWYVNEQFFLYDSSDFPIPVLGVVIPILISNNSIDEHNIFDSNQLNRLFSSAFYYAPPSPTRIIIVPIQLMPKATVTSALRDFNWWQKVFQEMFSKLESSNYAIPQNLRETLVEQIEIIDCSIDHLPELPMMIANRLQDIPSLSIDSDSSEGLIIPQLKRTTISLEEIGLGYQASEGFVYRAIRNLSANGENFKIWVDAAERPLHHSSIDIKDNEKYQIIYDSSKIALPRTTHDRNGNMVHTPAYHPYIEYKGMVYDSYKALYSPLPLLEFQNHIKSSWRKSIQINSNTPLPMAVSAFVNTVIHLQQIIPFD